MKTPPTAAVASAYVDDSLTATPRPQSRPSRGSSPVHGERDERGAPVAAALRPIVHISPAGSVERHAERDTPSRWSSSARRATTQSSADRAAADLLVAHEQWARADGETVIEGAPRSSLRDLARKLDLRPRRSRLFRVASPADAGAHHVLLSRRCGARCRRTGSTIRAD